MKKQTAVEWLVEQYARAFKIPVNAVMQETIHQALAMEKEQVLHHSVDPNEMTNHVPDGRKMVKDDVEKLAEEYAEKKYGGGQSPSYFAGFTDGYNKAKETLYTKEQVIAIVEKSRATGLTDA